MLADIVGESGQKILRAIIAGERDGQRLGAMKNVHVRAIVDEIAQPAWQLAQREPVGASPALCPQFSATVRVFQ